MTTGTRILKLITVRRYRVPALTVLLAVVWAHSQAAASGPWDSTELALMKSGEVIVEILYKGQPGGAARVSAMFSGNGEALWDVIGDCRYELIYVNGLQECEVLQSGNSNMIIRHRVRNSWYAPTLDFSFTADRTADGKGVARLLDGNLKLLESSWEVTPLEGVGTLIESERASIVTHEIRVQPKFLAPRWLIRRSLLRDLPDMLACVRGLANASAGQPEVLADRQRCPGDISTLSK